MDKEIDEIINKFINYTEKEKGFDDVDWKCDKNKIDKFFENYESKVESDKVKKSKYFKEVIKETSMKLAIMISNVEYLSKLFMACMNPN